MRAGARPARPDRMRPDRNKLDSSGRTLLIAFGVVAAAFMISTAVAEWSDVGIRGAAEQIAGNTSPSVEHLSLLRADLRRITLLGRRRSRRGARGAPALRAQADRQPRSPRSSATGTATAPAQLPAARPSWSPRREKARGGSGDRDRAARADRAGPRSHAGARGAGEGAAAGGQPASTPPSCASSTSTPRAAASSGAPSASWDAQSVVNAIVLDAHLRAAHRRQPGSRLAAGAAHDGAARASAPTSWRRSPGGWRTTWSDRCRPPAWRSICSPAAPRRPNARRARSNRGARGSCARG